MGTGYCFPVVLTPLEKEENWPQVITGMGPTFHEPTSFFGG